MDFKQFSFAGNIRVCLYNVGSENLAFHRHTHIADITYCAAGRLLLELPESDQCCIFHPGQIVQVPAGTVHRVSHCADNRSQSRYILIQIGRFSIDFVPAAREVPASRRVDLAADRLPFHIGDKREQLREIAAALRAQRPANLSDTEHADLQAALHRVCLDGLAGPALRTPPARPLHAPERH